MQLRLLLHRLRHESRQVDAAGHGGSHGAAVSDQILSGDVTGQPGIQEYEGPGLLVRGRMPSERNGETIHEFLAVSVLEVGHHRRVGGPRTDAVDPYALIGEDV